MDITLTSWTDEAKSVLEGAVKESNALHHGYVGSEHLLAGLFNGPNRAAETLASLGVTAPQVHTEILKIVGQGESPALPFSRSPLTPRAKKIVEYALREALAYGAPRVRPEHVLLAILREGNGVAARILYDANIDAERVRSELTALAAREIEVERTVSFLIVEDPTPRQPETREPESRGDKLHAVMLRDGDWYQVIRPEWVADQDGKSYLQFTTTHGGAGDRFLRIPESELCGEELIK